MDISRFRKLPLMGIMRGVPAEAAEPVCEAVVESGLETLEVAMNTPDAPEVLRRMVKAAGERLTIGAGTVINEKTLHAALECGATFIVLPVVVPEVVSHCVRQKIPVFPGALTPSEIYRAASCGATMVKVFPARCFGPDYFREIKGPLNDIDLLACGGVGSDNIRSFFNAGASAVAFGGRAFRKDWIEKKEFSRITDYIKALIEAFRK
ncbi:MAG: bifunctional 4-hydroxy-2-oxoglutarate aldolase/2-dehydro-3-deoxy-phosphogluconate aldolase [bacterium]